MVFKREAMSRLLLFIAVLFGSHAVHAQPEADLKLWYRQPADEWMKAVPIGNGRLGAMVYGGIEKETVALNEITMWSGQPDENQEKACGKEKLAEIRQLFFEGKYIEGNGLGTQYLSGTPHSFGSHVPVGDLVFRFDQDASKVKNYHRELDLRDAISRVSFEADGVTFTREYFASNPDNLLVFRFSADKPGSLSFDMGLALLRDATVSVNGNELGFDGQVSFPKLGPGGVHFLGKIRILVTGGSLEQKESGLSVKNADAAVVLLDIRTNYKNTDYQALCAKTISDAAAKTYTRLKQAHVADYRRLFDRVSISLGESKTAALPTDERWAKIKEGNIDTGLDTLFFQYGRYLLIASSRENSPLPANLQGVWNDNLACNMGWTCDYHLDINTEQNYWASNITNLHELNKPFFNYIEDLSVHGEKTAKKVYGSPGWVAHTVANVWGYTAPGEGVNWGLFPTASAWVATHLWSHYEYTQDRDFLKTQGYPILKKTAEFYLDYMVEDPKTGYLMTGPSISPENTFLFNDWELALSMMPTCDRVLVYEIYTACIESSKILGVDTAFRMKLEDALKRFPPIKVSARGTVQEWYDDVLSAHPNHRHSSQLIALYPLSQISLERTPVLAAAAKKSIYNQLHSEGWEDVEFSRANMINFYARLKEPEEAYKSIRILLSGFTRENLFTISPKGIAGAPWDIFIFDGNEAGVSGMGEMLIQNHEGYIEFLPTLPKEWNTGFFNGLCVKGGGVVDLKWKDGNIERASVRSTQEQCYKIKLPSVSGLIFKMNGKIREYLPDEYNCITVAFNTGDVLTIERK